MNFKNQSKLKAVTFSYDDGVTQDIRLIELLNKYGLKCTFNLNSEKLDTHHIIVKPDTRISQYKLHHSDVKFVYENHEVAAHTLTHPDLVPLDDAEVIRQVEQDRLNLCELVGYEVVGMAYPFGTCSDRVANLIKDHTGVLYSRTVAATNAFDVQQNLFTFNPTAHHCVAFENDMAVCRRFLESAADKPQILYIWGHSYEFDAIPNGWEKIEELFKLVSGHDDIFYGTNSEVLL